MDCGNGHPAAQHDHEVIRLLGVPRQHGQGQDWREHECGPNTSKATPTEERDKRPGIPARRPDMRNMPFADLRQEVGRCGETPARNERGERTESGTSSQEIGPDPSEDEVGNRHPSQRRGRTDPPRQPGRRIPEARLGVPDQGSTTEPGGIPRRGMPVASDLGSDPNVLGQEDVASDHCRQCARPASTASSTKGRSPSTRSEPGVTTRRPKIASTRTVMASSGTLKVSARRLMVSSRRVWNSRTRPLSTRPHGPAAKAGHGAGWTVSKSERSGSGRSSGRGGPSPTTRSSGWHSRGRPDPREGRRRGPSAAGPAAVRRRSR